MNEHPLIVTSAGVFIDSVGEIRSGCGVLVEAGNIEKVGPLEEVIEQAPPDTAVLDLGERFITPGLINTHVHLCFSGGADPGGDYRADRPETRLARALSNGRALLHSGVTTVRDCGSDWSLLALHDIVEKDLFELPNLLLSGPPITPTGGHLHQMGGEADGPEELRKLTRQLHKNGANSIKVMASGGQMTPGTLPEKPSFSLEELKAVTATAAEFGHPTVAHVLASESIRLAAQAGFDSLEHCAYFERAENGLLARCYDEEIAHEVKRAHASAMIGVAASYHTLGPARAGDADERETFLLRQEERMFDIVRRFVELEIPIVCGTDAGVKNTPFDETWLELVLLVERGGMTPLQALRVATVNSSRALRLTGKVGAIAEGERADLIALDANPLESPRAFAQVPWVMRRGRIVKGERVEAVDRG